MFHKGFLPVATLAVVVAIAGGQYQQPYDPYAKPCPVTPASDSSDKPRTDYVEQPYHQPAYPSSYRQPEPEHPAYIRTTTSSYNRPAYQQQPSRYSGYNKEPQQGYPTAHSQYPQQPYPQQPYPQPQPAANSYAPKAPAYAAICDFNTGSGTDESVGGRLVLTQDKGYDSPVTISGHITYLKPGKHGFHIHMYADFSNKCTSAGPHYNPLKVSHGSPNDPKNSRHIGDLGNIEAGYDGVAQIHIVDELVSLAEGGKFPIAGRAIVVHEKPDDLGRGGDEESGKTGNAGGRLRCCMIRYVDPTKLPKEY